MSAEDITERAKHIKFAIVADIADAASSNLRKQLETFRVLPHNVLGFAGVCSSHRIHVMAISGTREKNTIGDIHAVVYSDGLTSHHAMPLRAFSRLAAGAGQLHAVYWDGHGQRSSETFFAVMAPLPSSTLV